MPKNTLELDFYFNFSKRVKQMADVSNAFVKQFEKDVHVAYQQMGTKLRSSVRSKNNIIGSSTTFQKVGKGSASTKDRHGLVPTMNLDHTPVECTLADYYAGDWIDKLDELKTNIEERKIVVDAGAFALGRKTDDLIIGALNNTTNIVGDYTTGLTKSLIMSAFELFNANNVPDDGNRFAIVGVHQWSELLNLEEFSDADYVGDAHPWLKGTESRKWLGINWLMHTGIPVTDDDAKCFLYHKTAVGHAVGAEVTSDITWHGDRAAFFAANSMSQGSVIIDDSAVVAIHVDNDIALS
jgi:hypothetical protein